MLPCRIVQSAAISTRFHLLHPTKSLYRKPLGSDFEILNPSLVKLNGLGYLRQHGCASLHFQVAGVPVFPAVFAFRRNGFEPAQNFGTLCSSHKPIDEFC
jgi:hypothetical protein